MTMQIILDVPQALIDLPKEEQEALFRAGLREAASARTRQLEGEITEAAAAIQQFEARYGMSFAEFESEKMPESAELAIHEDYNDWFYWTSVLAEKKRLLASLQKSDTS